MERPKINKRKITNDWQKYCPELSKLRMLDIDNRVGPLVIGFYLQIIGDGTIYMPLYKVGNLYSHYSVLPSSLEIEGRSMDMQMHEIYSEQIAQQLIQKAYIPLFGFLKYRSYPFFTSSKVTSPCNGIYAFWINCCAICSL